MRGSGAAKPVYLFRFTALKKLIREHKNIIKQNTPPGIGDKFLGGVLFFAVYFADIVIITPYDKHNGGRTHIKRPAGRCFLLVVANKA